MASKRGTLIGTIATIIIGVAVIILVMNIIFDVVITVNMDNHTNSSVAQVRPIANAAVVMTAALSVVVVAAQMLGFLSGGLGKY
jgi:hypothetical protein